LFVKSIWKRDFTHLYDFSKNQPGVNLTP